MNQLWQRGSRQPSAQDRTLHSLCRPERLLELTYRFIVFDNPVKKICRYQQYFAVQATLERIKRVRGDQQRPGGVIWYTTGSGKSITMVLLAKALALEPGIKNPKVILVTDRVDLDDQIYRTFLACGKTVARAASGEDLLDLIPYNKAAIITTVIDKFMAAGRKHTLQDGGRDIFVLVDEGHRSQYGAAHAKMHAVFPNACYLGFTGTPLLKKEKNTVRKFGGFIHKYTMNQAVQDGAVTPLLYEGRMSELHGDRAQLDRWFERLTESLTTEQKLDLKKKFRREEELAGSNERIAEIAYDIGQHFKRTFKGTGMKGQLACSSKALALRYKRCFDDFGDVTTAVLISPPDTREDNTEVDEARLPQVQQFWKAMLERYGNERHYQETLINAFKYSDSPEIIIVVDKLLTGFDAPRNTVLYVDKRLREHNILQAIARVNRLFEGKQHGLIIDYRGIFGELNAAIDTYDALEREGFDARDLGGTLGNVLDEIKQLAQRHSNLWEVFKTVPNPHDIEAMQRHLEPEDVRNRFYDVLGAFARTLQLALGNAQFQERTPREKIKRYRDDLKQFLNLRAAVKQRYGETVDYSAYEVQLRNMVNQYIGADQVRPLVAPVDIFAVERLERQLEAIAGDAARADAIASQMKKTLTERMAEDPALYRRLSELIVEAIAEHRAKRISDAEYLKQIRERLTELRNQKTDDLPPGLYKHEDARAYYGAVKGPVAQYRVPEGNTEALAADIAIQIEGIIDRYKVRDWTVKDDVQNTMLNAIEDYLFSVNSRYGIDLGYEAIDTILHEVLAIAKRREAWR